MHTKRCSILMVIFVVIGISEIKFKVLDTKKVCLHEHGTDEDQKLCLLYKHCLI